LKQLRLALEHTESNETHRIAPLYNNMGIVLHKLGDSTRAKEFFLNSLKLNTQHELTIYYNLIEFYFGHNDRSNAIKIINEALEYHPDNPVILTYLGRYFYENNEYSEAREIFYKLLKEGSQELSPYLFLSAIECDVYENPTEDLINMLKEGLAKYPNSVSLINNYSYCQILAGNLSEAKKILARVDTSNNVFLSATKGLLEIKEGLIDEGRKLFNKAAMIAKKDKNLYAKVNQKKFLELGKYFSKIGNYKEATRLIQKGLKFKAKEKCFEKRLNLLLNELREPG
jgi:tetratricopeptide (TPR) repeat protein